MAETPTVEPGTNPEAGERTFSQAEVNAIVGERLAKEQAKYAGFNEYKQKAAEYDSATEAHKTELQKATARAEAAEAELNTLKNAETIRQIRQKVSADSGVPENLLTGSTEDECTAQAAALKTFAQNYSGYPSVQDGGEDRHSKKKTTAEQFSDWFSEAMK